MAENDDGFLTRWARRKEQARRGEELPEVAPEAQAGALPAVAEPEQAPAEQAEEEAKLIESLPDIDSMTRESDFSAFMQKGVPRALRNRALRKLWRLDPVFANLDGLNDYDEDYTAIGKGLGQAVSTLYQVGRGMGGDRPATEAKEAEPSSGAPDQTPPGDAAEDTAQTAEKAEAGDRAEGGATDAALDRPALDQPALDQSDLDQSDLDQSDLDQSDLDQSVVDQSVVDQPDLAAVGVPEPAAGAGSEEAALPGHAADTRKGHGAAARRWGRFAS